eukprot:CAMPEP_0171098182 /NCGR_PEP_ID=MMETSP0766_2-20121228/47979_1 /TAXON_ID=439317 /ORGANISM="Gambierdiscus australes, Strain CAWD 149" /LENGTH=162 /DNA_ID=CAMNT_0011557491 /DNA_START=51 /DNA_END=536 /DNA_ORIENTATION=-
MAAALAAAVLAAWATSGAAGFNDAEAVVQMATDVHWKHDGGGAKRAAKGAFVSDDEAVCLEAPAQSVTYQMQAIKDSPLAWMVANTKPQLGSCQQHGYALLVSKLDPCFKDTTIWKRDLSSGQSILNMAARNAMAEYYKKVNKVRFSINRHCYGNNGQWVQM